MDPAFDLLTEEVTIAYFDDPEDYEESGVAKGWADWRTRKEILVTHWMPIPSLPQSEFAGIPQSEFQRRFGNQTREPLNINNH
jgi:hypothetical protein